MHLLRAFPNRLCLGLLLLFLSATPSPAQQLDTTKLAGLKARAIGPAGMSGRVTAIDAVHSDPDIIYVGGAASGLWRSTNGGIDWEPLFDDQPVTSIGAIAVYQKNPSILYVGTGEGNPRNSQTSGNGVYKSIDGGRTWSHLGLDETRNIHRILVHPDNPDVVIVGAQGPAWGETEMRGVFKSTDGGKTWRKVLYVNERTGIADLVMDPANPDKLIAAMWEFRRWPWFFTSGGPGSGLFVSFDGGETWTRRTHEDGLPEGELGRIGLAIARSNPDVVYALVEAKKNGLYRSDDGGFTFRLVNDKEEITNRPFYYNDLFVDPANENRIYHVASPVNLSEDGGKNFKTYLPFSRVHVDHHAWWIHPEDPDLIYDGNDGGMYISRDRGKTWRFVENLPFAQFYHINVDMELPYNVLGGLQDNGSWRGPAYVWRQGGIRNAYWEEVAFGDGFDVTPDPSNPRYGYAMSQGGNLVRYDLETGHQKYIKPVHPEGLPLRFNWNAGFAVDPFDPATIYYGSQFVHKSTDRGDTWEIISPDLTTNDPEKQRQLESGGLTYDVTQAENFTTILTIAPSPIERGVLWVGTDDGNVQLTRDGGRTWTNVVTNIRGVPEGTWVPHIEASKHNPAEAFVVFDDHRRNNWTPYVFRTRDYGRSWERLVDENDVWGYALVVEQDPVAPNLLFLGTEFGLYVSIDGGSTWTKWTHGVPTASVMDLVIHPREHDLVIGTFGRSVFILDDIRPLRALAREGAALLDAPLHVFDPPEAYLAEYKEAAGTRFIAEGMFAGENRPYGAMITYVVNPPDAAAGADTAKAEGRKKEDRVTVEILDADGTVIRTLRGPAEPGLNRIHWELDRRGVRFPGQPKPKPDAAEPGGPRVLPGTYTVRVRHGDHRDSTTVTVHPDPRIDYDPAALAARDALIRRWMDRVALATEAADRLREAKEAVEMVNKQLGDRDDETAKSLKERGKAVLDSLKAIEEQIRGKEVQGIRRDPEVLTARLQTASRYLQSAYDAPGQADRIALDAAEAKLREVLDATNAFFAGPWAAYRQAVEAAGVSPFRTYEPLRLND
ncbi:hypothetical protein GQ464_002575 [Rhodocaloribacter litoris]|uniref:VPS10 domain-containing protein n=1 Tax=Rhodocaloribacter litoris TaxID=2558931 RepID=UPI00142084BF|nr:hypothetical protein [Rhodocaloribacter litoris]QXD15853.1 hypothetical protein GQ464_002575 [Rhodocaloribacter litoris]